LAQLFSKKQDSTKLNECNLIENLENGSTFMGLIGIKEKVKDHIKHVFQEFKYADIQPIILTGDDLDETLIFARSIGIIEKCSESHVAKKKK